MMRRRSVVALAGISLFAGYYIGAVANGGTPDTRVVTVHTPAKTIVHTKHDTEYVTRPLPDSCETVIDMLHETVKAHSKVGKVAGDILLNVGEISPAVAGDPQRVTEILSTIYTDKIALDDHLTTALQMETMMESALNRCDADIEASNNGDDVAPLDGEPGVSP